MFRKHQFNSNGSEQRNCTAHVQQIIGPKKVIVQNTTLEKKNSGTKNNTVTAKHF